MLLLVSETKTDVSRIVGRVEFDDLSRLHHGVIVSASPRRLPSNVCDGGQRQRIDLQNLMSACQSIVGMSHGVQKAGIAAEGMHRVGIEANGQLKLPRRQRNPSHIET